MMDALKGTGAMNMHYSRIGTLATPEYLLPREQTMGTWPHEHMAT